MRKKDNDHEKGNVSQEHVGEVWPSSDSEATSPHKTSWAKEKIVQPTEIAFSTDEVDLEKGLPKQDNKNRKFKKMMSSQIPIAWKFYEVFIGWMVRDLFLIDALWLNQVVHASLFTKRRRGYDSIPDAPSLKTPINLLQHARDYFRGAGFIFHRVWPIIFSGLFIHDYVVFYASPETRYGNTAEDILWGGANSQVVWTNRLGSGFPVGDSGLFWVPSPLVFLSPCIGAAYALYKLKENVIWFNFNSKVKHDDENFFQYLASLKDAEIDDKNTHHEIVEAWKQSHLKSYANPPKRPSLLLGNQDSSLLSDNKKQKFIQLVEKHNYYLLQPYHYYLANKGEISRWSKWKKGPMKIFFHRFGTERNGYVIPVAIFSLWILFTKAHFLRILIMKIMGIAEYNAIEKKCAANNTSIKLIEEYGNYRCSLCPDWEFVYYANQFTAQGCLDGLLASGQDVSEMLSKLNIIMQHPDFTYLNMTRLDWVSTPVDDLNQFFNKISEKINYLECVDLSLTESSQRSLDVARIKVVSNFVGKIKIKKFVMTHHGLSDDLASMLLPSFFAAEVEDLNLGFNNFSQLPLATYNITTVQTLNLQNNLMNRGVVILSQDLRSIRSLNLANCKINGQSFLELCTNLQNNTEIYSLEVSGNDLSALSEQDFFQCGQYTSNSSLAIVDLSNTQTDGYQNIAFLNGASPIQLKSIGFEGNLVDDDTAREIFRRLVVMKVSSVNLRSTSIQSLDGINQFFNNTQVENINLALGDYETPSLLRFIRKLPESKLVSLDLSGIILTQEIIHAILDVIQLDETLFRHLYLRNIALPLNASFVEQFIQHALLSHLESFIISDNKLSDVILANGLSALSDSEILNLDIGGNYAGEQTYTVLSEKLSGSKLENLVVRGDNNVPEAAGLKLVRSLVTSTSNDITIGDSNLPLDEWRALRKSKANTRLRNLEWNKDQLPLPVWRGMSQVLPNTNINYDPIFYSSFAENSLAMPLQTRQVTVDKGVTHLQVGMWFASTAAMPPVMLALVGLMLMFFLYRRISKSQYSSPFSLWAKKNKKTTGQDQEISDVTNTLYANNQ